MAVSIILFTTGGIANAATGELSLIHILLFDGEKVIKPEDLKECDTTEVLSVFGIDKKPIVKQKWRDLLKSVSGKHTGQMYVILIGAEAVSYTHLGT